MDRCLQRIPFGFLPLVPVLSCPAMVRTESLPANIGYHPLTSSKQEVLDTIVAAHLPTALPDPPSGSLGATPKIQATMAEVTQEIL
ncbi:uncharacterized protein L3040_004061 [Drepanopeziza brunnea f. sp. 'multigermtubi']|uniref:uncharacterized protein n=1 Tax=Drepanopeziza brunnea f. sp. 'multigermtubi' TaxID=698441 RepID=UPI00239B1C03|nr:hypothetical protein L3040_004061 [Drepanopeziza brunnea f. sp. 'multigermtubi']